MCHHRVQNKRNANMNGGGGEQGFSFSSLKEACCALEHYVNAPKLGFLYKFPSNNCHMDIALLC
jgi:hypothetical protein